MRMRTLAALSAAVLLGGSSMASATVLLSDSFNRTAGVEPPPATFDAGQNDNALGGSIVQTYLAGSNIGGVWVTDVGAPLPGGHTSVGQLNVRNRGIIVDYNFGADSAVQAAGGFIVEASFKPQQGISGREWNAVTIRSNNADAGTQFSIGDDPATTATVAGIGVRNISSVLRTGFAQGVSSGPPVTTSEPILDQPLFNSYVWGQALPNTNVYEIKIELSSTDFSATGAYSAKYYARKVGDPWTPMGQYDGIWGTANAAYVILAATRGDAGTTYTEAYFDSLKVSLIPEPSSLALLGLGGLLLARRRGA